MNWFQKNFKTIIYIAFLVPILTVAFVSISHVSSWYGLSNPMVGYFSNRSDNDLKFLPVTELYCHSEILCKKVSDVKDFRWESVNIDGIVGDSRYPNPAKA